MSGRSGVVEGGSPSGGDVAISVVVATPDGLGRLRKLLRHLAAQTIAGELELVVVSPTEEAVGDPAEAAAFGGVTVVTVGPIDDVDRVLAAGIRAARAPVVAILEDHAYPEPGWAEALVDAHAGPWAAVGPRFDNANPDTGLSWANLLLAYGQWVARREAGTMADVARHNSSFKRDVLVAYGEELEDRLVRGGGLLDDLRRSGKSLYFEPRARVAHVNPSRVSSTVRLRFDSGRLHAARAVEEGTISTARRAAYLAGAPLLPPLRLARLVRTLGRSGSLRRVLARAAPALLLALTADAAGRSFGVAFGPGGSEARLRIFELDRLAQVRPSDRPLLAA